MSTILVADDEKNIRSSLRTTFGLEGYQVETAEDGSAALEVVERGGIDLAVLDLVMPGMDGIQLLRELRRRGHVLPVILLSAHGSIEKAVEAVQLGAFDFIEKPPHADKLLLSARNALRQVALEEENRELRDASAARHDMLGDSPVMQQLFEQIRRSAPTQARVLILGENGTGKELIARALHRNSTRAAGPFVRVNCAAIPRELFESEPVPLPAQPHAAAASSSAPIAEHCFWTRSVRFRPSCSRNCCAPSSRERSSRSARTARSASTCASSRRPTGTWNVR
jgi:DNA-binding NtrC family response regulator